MQDKPIVPSYLSLIDFKRSLLVTAFDSTAGGFYLTIASRTVENIIGVGKAISEITNHQIEDLERLLGDEGLDGRPFVRPYETNFLIYLFFTWHDVLKLLPQDGHKPLDSCAITDLGAVEGLPQYWDKSHEAIRSHFLRYFSLAPLLN